MKKREAKMIEKSQSKKPIYTPEDNEIMKVTKQAKREKRKEKAQTEEDFDKLYKTYEKKLMKRLQQEEKGPSFEEIAISD